MPPNLDDPKVHEKIMEQVYRLDQNLKAMGLGTMDPQQLRGAYEKIKLAAAQVLSQKSQGPAMGPSGTPNAPGMIGPAPSRNPAPLYAGLAPSPMPSVPMSQLVEGGDIADSSGFHTQRLRKRLGIR